MRMPETRTFLTATINLSSNQSPETVDVIIRDVSNRVLRTALTTVSCIQISIVTVVAAKLEIYISQFQPAATSAKVSYVKNAIYKRVVHAISNPDVFCAAKPLQNVQIVYIV